MKKLALLAVLAALSFGASATQPLFGDTTNNYNTTNNTTNAPSAVGNGYGGAGGQGGQGGAGGKGGDGGNATVLGSGNSSNLNTNLNSNMQGQGQAQGQSQSSRNTNSNVSGSSSTSGAASSASASNGGNSTGSQSVHVEGDVTNIPRQAPAVSVGAPSQPITSCRLGLSLGGSSAGGAGAGGIPIGNDATCLAGAQLTAMERAGGFSAEDKQKAACGIEGMSIMSVCKNLSAPKTAAVAAPAVVTAKNEPSDPFVRARLGLPALK